MQDLATSRARREQPRNTRVTSFFDKGKEMYRSTKQTLFVSTALVSGLLSMALPTVASAQSADTGPTAKESLDGSHTGDIIVTARKRGEELLKVPVAITAFTGADLEARNIKTTSDLANFTPNLTADVASAGGARADRSAQLFIIRGMTPSTTLNPTVSVFINGVPVGGSDMVQNLDDLDHVEVLKGPQSAYFGRETFAGAINLVTKSAGDKLSGDFSGEAASRNTYRASGSVTVPIVTGFSFRIGGIYDKRDGSYTNASNPSQTLGNQETKGAHLAVTIKPDDNLTIKAFGTIFENNDGPAATGILLGSGFGLPAAFNQSNCKINGTGYFCGTLPSLTYASPAQVTTITTGITNFINNPGGLISKKDIVKGFGLRRLANHGDISIDWKVPNTGLTLSYLGGFNRDNWSEISDLANIDAAANGQYPGYAGFPFIVENRDHAYSHEVRIASDPAKRLRFLLGGSYLKASHEQINAAPAALLPLGSPAISRTRGVFFSVAFDILDNLTLTGEGRYQADTEIAENPARAVIARGTSKDFLPRVTLQYTPVPGMLTYATFSRGVNPGLFNSQFNSLPTRSQAALTATGAAGGVVVQPEKLDNYEIGIKGRFWGGKLTLSAAAYYDVWSNQINTNAYNFAANDPNNPYNVVGFSGYNPANTSIYIYSFQDNSARSKAKGVEAEATIIPIPHITVNLSGSYSNIHYSSFNCTSCAPYSTAYPGFNAAGNQLPNSPRWQSAVGVQYDHETSILGSKGFFVRADYFYHSGIYIQSSNTVKTPDSNTVNFRAGLDFAHFSIEGFVNNAFNERAFTSGFQNYNFPGFFTPAVMVGLPTLITAGARIHVKF
jgi:iron complex outermembrane receptor protein